MKYKDILVGEWFQYGSNVFIKTKHPVYGLKNYIMESSLHFGENWGGKLSDTRGGAGGTESSGQYGNRGCL